MKKNMGNADKLIRLGLAVVFVILWFQNIVTGTLGIILLVLAGIFVLTSIFGFCPLYKLLGINSGTQKKTV
jgi:fatty acid desaturase